MTSEIRANTIKNRVGLGTVSYTNTGIVVSGIVTANSFSGTGDLDVDGHTNLDNVNIVGVTTISQNLALNASGTTYPLVVHADADYKGIMVNGSYAPTIGFNILDNATPSWKLGIHGSSHHNFALSTGTGNTNKLIIQGASNGGKGLFYGDWFATNLTMASTLYHDGDTDTGITFSGLGDIIDLKTGGTTRLRAENSGLVITGISTFSGNIFGTGDLTLTDTTTDSAAGPEFKLFRNSASPADADYLGQIKFAGESDTGVERNYAKITGKILDASNGTEDGILEFAHIKAGSQTITGRWRSDSLQLLNSTNLSVDGQLAIGHHSAAYQLDILKATSGPSLYIKNTHSTNINGSFRIQNNSAGNLYLGVFGASAGAYGQINANDAYLGTAEDLSIHSISNTGVIKFGIGASGPSEKMRIASNGTVLFGTTTNASSIRAVFQGYPDGGENFQARIRFQTAQATNLTSGSHIANLLFTNASGSEGARIDAKVDSNWGTGSYPSRIEFSTTASSANTPTERLRIDSDGLIIVGNSGTKFGNMKIQSFVAHGANASTSAFSAVDTTSVAAGVGGEIAFHGKYNTGAQDWAYFGHIKGAKENATAGDTACALKFFTRPNATAPQERLRIKSNGYVGVNQTDPQYPLHVSGATTVSAPTGEGILMGLQHDHALIHLNAADTKGSIIDFSVPGADRRGGILYYHSNNPTVADRDVMKFCVNGSTYGMEIKSNGIVTHSQQPGFFAYMDGGNQTTNANSVIPFNLTHFNNGGHFKTSGTNAYKFVCPVAGIYHFSGAIWMKNANSGAHARWQIRKNNAIQVQAGWHQNANNNDFYDHSAPAAITLYCNVGDLIHAHADYQIQYWRGGSGHPHTYFSGHFVG